jgi:TonB family protein
MPLNVRGLYTSVLLILSGLAAFTNAQTVSQTPSPAPQTPAPQLINTVKAPTSAEIMRDRISKAKAFIAVRNYNAAIYELENIRRETSDVSVQGVTNVLLMNSYLEQGDYKRAQDFLTEAFNIQKTTKPNASDLYNAVAGQVIKGARTKVERYKALGLMVADRNLPLEAVNDIERMRETLELVITQTKDIGKDKVKSNTAMALLEEATNSRGALARDDYDARRWKDEIADSREQLANSRSVITNAVDGTTSSNALPATMIAVNTTSLPETPTIRPKLPDTAPVVRPPLADTSNKPSDALLATNEKPVVEDTKKTDEPVKSLVILNTPKETTEPVKQNVPPQTETAKASGPIEVGSLKEFATKQTIPVYPSTARSMRTTGIVKVEVTVDESGDVTEVQKTSGPSLLQTAAKEAVRKWKFKPFVRDGQPVRATGFVNFNFSL